jgi:hypothetical protein
MLLSTAAVAGLLLPSELRGQQAANRAETPQGNLALTGGQWFDGQTFRDHATSKKTVYTSEDTSPRKNHRASMPPSI